MADTQNSLGALAQRQTEYSKAEGWYMPLPLARCPWAGRYRSCRRGLVRVRVRVGSNPNP